MTTKPMTKEAKMLQLLRRGPVTSFDAVLSLPTTQAQYYVYSLREKGFNIMTERTTTDEGVTYATWHLLSEPRYKEGTQLELNYE